MIARILAKTLPVVLLLLGSAAAQTVHTFTFGKFDSDPYTGMVTGTAAMQTLDGQPANCSIGYCGVIMVPYNDSPYWGLQCPQSWGFPNGCDLTNNTSTPLLSAPVFQSGCGPKIAGCTDYETGTADFVGYGQGVTVSVTVWFQVNQHKRFGRGCYPCIWYTNDETNGTGTTSYTP